jgi:hypothetical protein
MVSSYLVCDLCGRFGPPASTFSEDGLRLCYQCWFEARRSDVPPATDADPSDAETGAGTMDKEPDSGTMDR